MDRGFEHLAAAQRANPIEATKPPSASTHPTTPAHPNTPSSFAHSLSLLSPPSNEPTTAARVSDPELHSLLSENQKLQTKVTGLKHLLSDSSATISTLRADLQSSRAAAFTQALNASPETSTLADWFDSSYEHKMLQLTNTRQTPAVPAARVLSAAQDLAAPTLEAQSLTTSHHASLHAADTSKISALTASLAQCEASLASSAAENANLAAELAASHSSNTTLTTTLTALRHTNKRLQNDVDDAQMEVNMVCDANASTNAAANSAAGASNNARGAVGDQGAKIEALEAWASSAAEGKATALARVAELEALVVTLRGDKSDEGQEDGEGECVLRRVNERFVVAAGGVYEMRVQAPLETIIRDDQEVVVRWEFEVYGNADVDFGVCLASSMVGQGGALFKERSCVGGSAGSVAVRGNLAVVLRWRNGKAWIKPRTVRCRFVEVCLGDKEV